MCQTKVCTLCQEEKLIEDFPLSYNKKYPESRSSRCKKCRNRLQEERRLQNPHRQEYKKQQFKKWAENNQEKLKQYREKTKQRSLENYYKRNYNLTIEQVQEIKRNQKDRCYICRKETRLRIDHCHTTGKVRKALCNGCNRGLGFFNESIESLQKAIEYLKEHA